MRSLKLVTGLNNAPQRDSENIEVDLMADGLLQDFINIWISEC